MFLNFIGTDSLDSRVTFTRALNTATRVNSSGLIETVNANLPRFDYDPVTLAPKGLLVEESRINALTSSEEFDNIAWTLSGILAFGSGSVVNATNSPVGTQTADLITPDTTNSPHRVLQSTTFVASTSASFSLFVKANGYTKVGIRESATSGAGAAFDLSNGTVIGAYDAGGSTVSNMAIISYLNGWYKISLTITFGISTIMRFGCHVLSPSYAAGGDLMASWVPNGTSGIYPWGAQLEAGAFATSYIPSTTLAVTRNADFSTMTGTNFSSWYNPTEGTFVANCSLLALSTTQSQELLNLDDGASTNVITVNANNTAGSASSTATTASVSQGFLNIAGVTAGPIQKIGHAIKLNDAALVRNGSTVVTDATYTVPTGINRMAIGARTNGFAQINGHIRSIAYYNTRLPNATLQALTA